MNNVIINIVIMMVWCFTSLSTLFKPYSNDGKVIMKGSVQGNYVVQYRA